MAHWQQIPGSKKVDINKGPAKFDLMLGLFEGKILEFTITDPEGKTKIDNVRLSSVEREDGSNQSWNIRGLYGEREKPFAGYYSTRTGQGIAWPIEWVRS